MNDEPCNPQSPILPQMTTSGSDEADERNSCESPGHQALDGEETEHQLELEPEPERNPLQECDIDVYGLTWEDYNRTALTEQEIFDLIISDPFQRSAAGSAPVIDCDRRASFVQFMKKVLVPGGYVFVVVPQMEVAAWLTAFEEFDFKPEGIFTLLKDPASVQRVEGKRLQNLIEVGAVARKGGRHPRKFVMDVVSPYTQLPRNRYNRKAPVVDNIAPPPNRLFYPGSKTMVRIGEKPPALIWELMKTFCPAGGKVLDPFVGTLPTGIASVQSGRSCVLLESDERCLSLGKDRLTNIARMKLEQANLGSSVLLEPSCDDGLCETKLPNSIAQSNKVVDGDSLDLTITRRTSLKSNRSEATTSIADDDVNNSEVVSASAFAISSQENTEEQTPIDTNSIHQVGIPSQTDAITNTLADTENCKSTVTRVDNEPLLSPDGITIPPDITLDAERERQAFADTAMNRLKELSNTQRTSDRVSVITKPNTRKKKKKGPKRRHITFLCFDTG